MENELIKRKIISIMQEPELKQLIGKGKGVQMPIWVNIIGDSAIEKVSAEDGDIKAAMKYIISLLPQPKLIWLRALAIEAATEICGTRRQAAEFLNISARTAYDRRISWIKLSDELKNKDICEENDDNSR